MRDEGWIASHKSQSAHHNPTRNFFSHEKQISDCFHVKQGECVNPRNKKKNYPTDHAHGLCYAWRNNIFMRQREKQGLQMAKKIILRQKSRINQVMSTLSPTM